MHYQVFRNKNSSDADFELVNQIYKRIMSEDKALCDAAQKNLNAGVFINGVSTHQQAPSCLKTID